MYSEGPTSAQIWRKKLKIKKKAKTILPIYHANAIFCQLNMPMVYTFHKFVLLEENWSSRNSEICLEHQREIFENFGKLQLELNNWELSRSLHFSSQWLLCKRDGGHESVLKSSISNSVYKSYLGFYRWKRTRHHHFSTFFYFQML